MTMTTDFDRHLTSWLETAGPADMNPDGVDAALATARGTGRRHGLRAFLFGPTPWPASGRRGLATMPRAIRLAIAVGLLAGVVAGGIYIGSRLLQQVPPVPSFDAIQDYSGRISRLILTTPVEGIEAPVALPDGRVVGFKAGEILTWSPGSAAIGNAGRMSARRFAPGAVALADGRVLIIGGDMTMPDASGESRTTTSTVEVWDPRWRTSSSPISMTTPHDVQDGIRLADGRVLISGGLRTSGRPEAVAAAEIFDPTTNTFSQTGSMTMPRVGHSMVLLPDGRVLVIGGSSKVSDAPDTWTTEIYDPQARTFSTGDSLDEIVPLPDDSRYPLSTRTPIVRLAGGEVLVPGLLCQEVHAFRPDGTSDGARQTPIERFDPVTGQFSVVGHMPHCVHTAVPLPNGELYVIGWWYSGRGTEFGSSHSWAGLYDPDTGDVREVDVPSVNAQPYVDIVVLPDGRVLFFGSGAEVMD